MTSRCDGSLGWPVDDPPVSEKDEIVRALEELREEVAPEWSPRRGAYNMSILVAKGLRLKR